MSQIWPDIPELDGVPEVLRSALWMKAYTAAIGRRITWFLGLLGLVTWAALGGVLGHRSTGTAGAVVGGLLGTAIAMTMFVRVILEWQARRLLPAVLEAAGWPRGTVAGLNRTTWASGHPPAPGN